MMMPQRLAERAYADILGLIRDGDLQIGQRLPAEGRLAIDLGVSRTIIREALARLASDGITEARRGAGSFLVRKPSELLGRHMPPEQISSTLGTYEVRMVLEPEACKLAALRRSDEALARIEACLAALCDALRRDGPAADEDLAFHQAIMEATGNDSFLSTFAALNEATARVMRAGVDISRSRPPSAIEAMIVEHRDIVDAIRAGDPDRAALAMRWHLSQGRRRLMP